MNHVPCMGGQCRARKAGRTASRPSASTGSRCSASGCAGTCRPGRQVRSASGLKTIWQSWVEIVGAKRNERLNIWRLFRKPWCFHALQRRRQQWLCAARHLEKGNVWYAKSNMQSMFRGMWKRKRRQKYPCGKFCFPEYWSKKRFLNCPVQRGGVHLAAKCVLPRRRLKLTLQRRDKVAPEPGLLGEGRVVGVEVQVHLAHATVWSTHAERRWKKLKEGGGTTDSRWLRWLRMEGATLNKVWNPSAADKKDCARQWRNVFLLERRLLLPRCLFKFRQHSLAMASLCLYPASSPFLNNTPDWAVLETNRLFTIARWRQKGDQRWQLWAASGGAISGLGGTCERPRGAINSCRESSLEWNEMS